MREYKEQAEIRNKEDISKRHEQRKARQIAAGQDVVIDKIPTLKQLIQGRTNNIAIWILKVEKRYAQVCSHYPDRIGDFVATVKAKCGPLYNSIKHKVSISEIFSEISPLTCFSTSNLWSSKKLLTLPNALLILNHF